MKRRSTGPIAAIIFVAMLAIGGSAGTAAAQQTDFGAIQDRILELYAGGDFAPALIEARKLEAAVRAELGTETRSYGVALSLLGLVHQAQGQYAEAENYLERALRLLEKTQEPGSVAGLGPTLNNLATVYIIRGRYADAERTLKRTLTVTEQTWGANHPNVASVLINLANVQMKQGNQPEAMRLLKRAREIELGASAR